MKKRILHIIIIFLLVIVLLIDVVSAFSLSVFMTPSTTNVQAESEVVIKVKVSNLEVGDNGINTFNATLNYDTDVFETLTADNIVGLNNWTATYTPDTGKIALVKTTFTNSDEEIFQISLKTKSNISKNSGAISLKNIIVGNGNDDISATEVNTSIAIGNGVVITPQNLISNNTNTINNNVNTNTNPINISNNNNISNYANTNSYINNSINTNNSIYNNINDNEALTNSEVPYTGTRENVRIALIILLIIAGYIYIKFEKLNKVC